MCPDPWPSPDIVITNWAACLGSASQLKEEQNIHIPCAGSELHAAPTTPQIASPFPSPSDTLACENQLREGTASEWCATDICPKSWEPPNLPCGEGTVGTHYCLAVGNDEGLELDETDKDEELGESDEEEVEKDEG